MPPAMPRRMRRRSIADVGYSKMLPVIWFSLLLASRCIAGGASFACCVSSRGDRSLRAISFNGAAEQLSEHANQDFRGVRQGLFGPPGDVHVWPHHDPAIFIDLALPIPAGVDVLRIAASGTDTDDIDRQAVGRFDRGGGRTPAFAAD